MITVNIRYIRIQNVSNAGSVNFGTTLNIVACPEGKAGDTAPIPPQPEAPPVPPVPRVPPVPPVPRVPPVPPVPRVPRIPPVNPPPAP